MRGFPTWKQENIQQQNVTSTFSEDWTEDLCLSSPMLSFLT